MIVAMVNGGMAPATDEELMACLATRDIEAFEALYDRYGTLVYSTALRVAGDVHLAEDITQEVFLRIWRHPDRYVSQRGRFVPWLLSVTRNGAVDQVRSRGRRRRHELVSEQPEREPPTGDGHDPALMAELADERQRIRRALANLPAEQRQTIEMAYFGGYTQQEIAALLSEPLGTVKTRIRLGMQKLRVFLTPEVEMVSLGSA
jgi:RNA polymerase sigma-70 factor (ECF subfamily)